MKNKIAVVLITFVVVALVVALGCGKEEEKAPVEKTEAIEEAKEIAKPSAEMNDDIYVEITAYMYYLPDKYKQKYGELWQGNAVAIEEYSAEPEKLYKKYGITEDVYSNYEEQVKEDVEHYTKLKERINKRAEELSKPAK
jgi:hypothetical protein